MIKYQIDNLNKLDLNPSIYFPWIEQVIRKEGFLAGNILYHFCDDDFLLRINNAYLQHDYLTDIITFPLSEQPEIISAEIFISIDRVKDNAKKLGTDFVQEFSRVLVHGVLHLMGYDDHTEAERREMRAKEDYYLSLLPQK